MTEKRSYVLIVEVPIAVAIEVQAESIEEAIKLAREADNIEHAAAFEAEPRGWWSPGTVVEYEPSKGELVDLHVDGRIDCFAEFKHADELWEEGRAE
jgi:hypothetical protein